MAEHRGVTVVIPFLRGTREDWLKEAIGSLPPKIPYIVAENDGELADALNGSIRAAKTEFVFRLDADDALDPVSLPILLDLAWDCDVTYPSLFYCLEDLTPFELRKAPAFCPNRLLIENYISGCALMRRDAVLAVGGYRDMEILEDWDLWVRMMRAGRRFKAVPEARLYYRRHGVSRNTRPGGQIVELRRKLKQQIVGEEPDIKATFYYQAGTATIYWRCLLPARHLPGQAVDHATATPVESKTDEGSLDLDFSLEHRGTAIYQFPGDSARAVMMAEMQAQGIKVMVESDDNYFDNSPLGNPGWVKNLKPTEQEKRDPNRRRGVHSLEAHRRIVPWADGVIVTTEQLARRYRKFNDNVYICPNQIDPDDWAGRSSFLPLKDKTWRDDDGIFRIGWFASPSHEKDAQLVKKGLEWASKQDGVEIVTVGLDPHWYFTRTHIPWSNDIGIYRKLIAWLDVGLAPVVETPWSVCRSDLKALEYGIVGACPLLSDSIPYRDYGGPCLRAKDNRDFLNQIRYLVRNRDEAKRIGREARDYVLKERTMSANIWRWEEAVEAPLRVAA